MTNHSTAFQTNQSHHSISNQPITLQHFRAANKNSALRPLRGMAGAGSALIGPAAGVGVALTVLRPQATRSHPSSHPFIHSSILSSILSSSIHPSFIHTFIHPFIHLSFIRSFIHPFIHLFIHSSIHSSILSFIFLFIHPFILPFIHTII